LKVVFLTEGGKQNGYGHIFRSISIAEAFVEKKADILFLVNGDSEVVDVFSGINVKVMNWLSESIDEYLSKCDMVIVDSYLCPEKIYKIISLKSKLAVYIDDNIRLNYPPGVVLNGTIGAEHFPYVKNDKVKYILGAEFFPVRKEFWDLKERVVRSEVKDILITLGGQDIRGLTPVIVELLSKFFPKINKHVVIGKGFDNVKKIESLAASNIEFYYSPDASKMKELMLMTDCTVSAGGQTIYELAIACNPPVIISIIDNQNNNIKGWQKKGFGLYAGKWSDENLKHNIVTHLTKLIDSRKLRSKIVSKGTRAIDGQGARRIVNFLLSVIT